MWHTNLNRQGSIEGFAVADGQGQLRQHFEVSHNCRGLSGNIWTLWVPFLNCALQIHGFFVGYTLFAEPNHPNQHSQYFSMIVVLILIYILFWCSCTEKYKHLRNTASYQFLRVLFHVYIYIYIYIYIYMYNHRPADIFIIIINIPMR